MNEVWLDNIYLTLVVATALKIMFYFIGHWLFAYRYFEVAEMLGRDDKTLEKHEKVRKITCKICYVGVAVIIMSHFAQIANVGIYMRLNEPEFNATL
jgi:hypothetical protein